ncbi:MAG: pentapeptide repeat-containing protein [Rothia mucilaginosa]|nr:pentapeptide repeat-containing protein [Rothia mucilaginosa]
MANNETPLKEPPYIRYFSLILIFLGCLGGFLALTVPLWKSLSNIPVVGPVMDFLSLLIPASDTDNKYPESKAIADLRLHILYITGGIIAILTLLQTSWKNQVDRRKVEADIQKNEQDAKNEAAKREQDAIKSERDHNRQVHAERRSRYAKAIEQLANEKAAVRLGGIYTLVGLVDEWLADETLEQEEQQKEGQVIINNLCSYIRSPFPLAEEIEEYETRKELEKLQKTDSEKLSEEESSRLQVLLKRFEDSGEYEKPKDITADYAKFHEEQDVRRTIFVEMSKRSSAVSVDESKKVTVKSGAWSGFKFDFSRAPIFYPLNNLTIEQGQFSSARFYGNTNFIFAKFTGDADFTGAIFTGNTDFRYTTFNEYAYFVDVAFSRTADFSDATFNRFADFLNTDFSGDANFWTATFTGEARFRNATFSRTADFTRATFTRNAYFTCATFTRNAYFALATFNRGTHFECTTFSGDIHFQEATFTGGLTFGGSYFEKYAPTFAEGSDSARFSDQVNWTESNFAVRSGSQPIELGSATLGDKTVSIPFGTVVFDPGSWDEQTQEYSHMSVTCCRIYRSSHHQE